MAQCGNRVLFDLSELEYLSSGGLRIILIAVKDVRRREGKVILTGLNPYVHEIFQVSGLTTMITIAGTVEEVKVGDEECGHRVYSLEKLHALDDDALGRNVPIERAARARGDVPDLVHHFHALDDGSEHGKPPASRSGIKVPVVG